MAPIVSVYFTVDSQREGRTFSFSRAESSDKGKEIASTGIWDDFPIDGVPIESVEAFGERLRQ